MSFDNEFKELISNVMSSELNEMASPEAIAAKINKLMVKQGVMEIDEETLVAKITGLSENAMLALIEAIKDKEVFRVLSVLGIKFSDKEGISGDK
jgi:hypothetical protein